MEKVLKDILLQMLVMSNNDGRKIYRIAYMQDETNKRFTKAEATIENTINVKIQALFEDREVVHSKLDSKY